MNNTKPLISIAGVAFVIDVTSEEFIDFSEPINRISFRNLLRRGIGYVLLFDPLKSGIWTGNPEDFPDHILVAHIGPIVSLDPAGLAKRLNKPLSELQNMEDDAEWLEKYQVESCLRTVDKWKGR